MHRRTRFPYCCMKFRTTPKSSVWHTEIIYWVAAKSSERYCIPIKITCGIIQKREEHCVSIFSLGGSNILEQYIRGWWFWSVILALIYHKFFVIIGTTVQNLFGSKSFGKWFGLYERLFFHGIACARSLYRVVARQRFYIT